jgi:hypothetical protein
MTSSQRRFSLFLFSFLVLFLVSCALNEESPSGVTLSEPPGRVSLDVASGSSVLGSSSFPDGMDLASGTNGLMWLPFETEQTPIYRMASPADETWQPMLLDNIPAGSAGTWTLRKSIPGSGPGPGVSSLNEITSPFDGTTALELEIKGPGTTGVHSVSVAHKWYSFPEPLVREQTRLRFDTELLIPYFYYFQYAYVQAHFYRNGVWVGCLYKGIGQGQGGSYFWGKNYEIPLSNVALSADPDAVKVELWVKGSLGYGAFSRIDNIFMLKKKLLKVLEPLNNSVFDEGTPITFTAGISGQVSNINWKTNYPQEKTIGTGETIEVDDLETNPATGIATHTITVTGTTSGGGTVTDSIQIGIRALSKLSVIEIAFQSGTEIMETPPPPPAVATIKPIPNGIRPAVNGVDDTLDWNRNLLYDRVNHKELGPPQWFVNVVNQELVEGSNFPISYVRSGAPDLVDPAGKSKMRLNVKVQNFSSNAAIIDLTVSGTMKETRTGEVHAIKFLPQIGVQIQANSTKEDLFMEMDPSSELPGKVGKWKLELNWNYFKPGTDQKRAKQQRTPVSANAYHLVYTSWKKPAPGGPNKDIFSQKCEIYQAIGKKPLHYLEIVDYSTQFSPSSPYLSELNFLKQLFENVKESQEFMWKGGRYLGWQERGIDYLLINKHFHCFGISELFDAMACSQGINTRLTAWSLKNPLRLFETRLREALNSFEGKHRFTDHAMVLFTETESGSNQTFLFDLSFPQIYIDPSPSTRFDYKFYEDKLFGRFGNYALVPPWIDNPDGFFNKHIRITTVGK